MQEISGMVLFPVSVFQFKKFHVPFCIKDILTGLFVFLSCQQNRYMYRDADRLWKGQNQNGDSKITWHEYNQTTYSGMSGMLLFAEMHWN